MVSDWHFTDVQYYAKKFLKLLIWAGSVYSLLHVYVQMNKNLVKKSSTILFCFSNDIVLDS